MRTHQGIDMRSLLLDRIIAARIDADPERAGLARARETCARWLRQSSAPAIREWHDILARDWEEIRASLLDESGRGRRLRQSSPFCGILSPQERWESLRSFTLEHPSA